MFPAGKGNAHAANGATQSTVGNESFPLPFGERARVRGIIQARNYKVPG